MSSSYANAQRRLNTLLSSIFFVDEAGALIAFLGDNRWLAIVWVASGVGICLIGAQRGTSTASLPDDDELPSEEERTTARVFACRALYLSNLVGVTVLAIGMALDCTWWSNLLFSILSWFVSLFAILLLCNRTRFEEPE